MAQTEPSEQGSPPIPRFQSNSLAEPPDDEIAISSVPTRPG